MATFTTNTEPELESQGVLASWKGIAAYFGCNVRTAKRWERERGLPVRRAPGKKSGTVFARISELDAWLESREDAQMLDSATSTGGTVGRLAVVAQNNSKPVATTLPPPISSDEYQAKPASFLRWRPWVLASSVLLVFAVTLFWKVGNRQTASATTFSHLDTLNGKPHIAASGAADLFLRGRYYWNLRTADGLAKAIDSYTQAIVTDPSYAEAYAGLAECYDLLPQFGQADLGDSLRKAEHAADRAIELNPNLASAHTAKAFALYYWDWDIAGSDAEFKRALALDPNSAQTHQWYAGTLECRSEGAKAIQQIDEAVRLDPTSPAIATDAALLHADFGDFKSGVKALKEIERTQPTLSSPAEFLADLDFATGDFPAYIQDTRRFASITHAPDAIALANGVAQGWARAGRTGLLEARAEALKAAFDKGTGSGFLIGENLLLLGRHNEALVYFRASFDRHDDRLLQLMAFDDYAWVRELSSDPGYAALFAKIRRQVREVTPAQPEHARVSEELPQ
jgi:tetratricopeptide (TPR) repeat protein